MMRPLYQRIGSLARDRNWDLNDWRERGCALHLEVSELVEAMRSKGDSTVIEEAADVLLCLYAITKSRHISPIALHKQLSLKLTQLESS